MVGCLADNLVYIIYRMLVQTLSNVKGAVRTKWISTMGHI